MAHTATHTTEFSADRAGSALMTVLAAIGNWLVRIGEKSARIRLMNELATKSDAELAQMGLRREDIARYVFRDTYYV